MNIGVHEVCRSKDRRAKSSSTVGNQRIMSKIKFKKWYYLRSLLINMKLITDEIPKSE